MYLRQLATALLLLINLSLPVLATEPYPGLSIRELAPGLYQHRSYQWIEGYGYFPSNGVVVLQGKDAYLIDTPWSEADTAALLDWLDDRGLQLRASLSTHSHEDRTAGIGLLNARGIETVTSAATNAILADENKALATSTFAGDSYWLLPDKIEAYYPGPGHTSDNLVVWLPEQQWLVGGCLIRDAGDTRLGYIGEASIKDWPDSVTAIMARYPHVQGVLPGHGEAGSAELLRHTRDLALAARGDTVK